MRCPVAGCGEPWSTNDLNEWSLKNLHSHPESAEAQFVAHTAFRLNGCLLFNKPHMMGLEIVSKGDYPGIPASMAYNALIEMKGNDFDGIEMFLKELGL